MKFFVWLDERQEGPFDEETIQKIFSEGHITQETLLHPEDGDLDWTPARELFPQDLGSGSDVAASPPGEMLLVEATAPGHFEAQADDGSRLEIRLTSGVELKIKAVRLYDEIELAELNSKKVEAMKKFQGVSTGLGAIGSIEWVLAASVVIGAVEAALSAGASSAGARLLEEAIEADRKLRKRGVFCAVGKVQLIENPVPGLWRVPTRKDIQVEVKAFLGPKMETRNVPSAFIHNGDEFLSVVAEDDSVCSIRWSTVEQYFRVNTTP